MPVRAPEPTALWVWGAYTLAYDAACLGRPCLSATEARGERDYIRSLVSTMGGPGWRQIERVCRCSRWGAGCPLEPYSRPRALERMVQETPASVRKPTTADIAQHGLLLDNLDRVAKEGERDARFTLGRSAAELLYLLDWVEDP